MFNVLKCHCALVDQVMSPFRGSCCEKMAKSYSRSTFLACFDLLMSVFFKITLFYEIYLVEHIFNILLPLFPILVPVRGSCCVKIAQKY